MRCQVLGCGSSYANKANTARFFRAITDTQWQLWREILLRYGVDDFMANDLICSLHFKEDDIEKYRTEYKTGGVAYKVPLKYYALRHNAVPTIFPSEIPRNEKRKRLSKHKYDYAVKLDDETIAKQRKMFQAYSCTLEVDKDKPVKENIVRKKAVKRKISIGSTTDIDPLLMEKLTN